MLLRGAAAPIGVLDLVGAAAVRVHDMFSNITL